jgi:SlyX protein
LRNASKRWRQKWLNKNGSAHGLSQMQRNYHQIAETALQTGHFVSNTGMEQTTDHAKRLNELEIKASFSEDTLDQLNLVVVRQQQEIDLLRREIQQLKQQALERNADVGGTAGQELPPHY